MYKKLMAAVVAAVMAVAGAGAGPVTVAAAAQAQPARVDRNFLLGRWTDTNDCSNAVDFLADGRFRTTSGAEGRWTLEGDRLSFIGQRTIVARVAATGPNAISLTHEDGSVGSSTRCGAPAAARRTMPALPTAIAAAVAMSRPYDRGFLLGRWTDDGDCARTILFRSDGVFEAPTGQGRWTLDGERLSFIGTRTITARSRAVGNDRILLIHEDGTIGQSIRC